MEQILEVSPEAAPKMAGIFYLLSVATAIVAEVFVRGRLLFAVDLIPVLCFAVATLLLYRIFKPINRRTALFAAAFNLAGLTFEALELHLRGVNVAMTLHGIYCLLIGYLVFRSTFLPRFLGALMALAGLGWLVSVSPLSGHTLRLYGQALGFLGEGALMLWLLVKGTRSEAGGEASPSMNPS